MVFSVGSLLLVIVVFFVLLFCPVIRLTMLLVVCCAFSVAPLAFKAFAILEARLFTLAKAVSLSATVLLY